MDSQEIREKFLKFFEEKGHKIVPSSSLVPTDPSVLLTTAGMQQFKPYYSDEKSPYGDSVASIQKCFRISDIDAIGDESHLSFFEMLGNFSFGGYFKEKAIKYGYDFITKGVGLKIDYVSVFEGDKENGIPVDEESEKIWKSIDPNIKIKKAGKEDNFWGPTGSEGPCGPTSEIYVNGIEIWNLVFNEYYKDSAGKFTKLKIPGADTGMGLERLAMAVQKKNNIFETDLFAAIINAIIPVIGDKPIEKIRIIADHLRGATFLIGDGVKPSNLGRGYILRRLIRRAMLTHYKFIGAGLDIHFYKKPVEEIIRIYGAVNQYKNLIENREKFFEIFGQETEKFSKTIERGAKIFEKISGHDLSGEEVFDLYQTYGFPIEMTAELAKEKRISIDEKGFSEEMKKHQELSRTASQGMFKSGLADHSEQVVKYHTAAHLMLAALRKVLGEHVIQRGSNITGERLRFDFSHPEKMTMEQIKQVEDLVNQKIKEDLPVKMEEMSLEEAKKQGAAGIFELKYGEKVKVYSIGHSTGKSNSSASSEPPFSREICAGPHAEHTGVLGHFKIIKEESSSADIRRIKAVLK